MAHYTTKVRSPWSAEAAFDYLADLEHFAEWDPGVSRSVRVEGSAGSPDAVHDVTVGASTLRYRTLEVDRPTRLVVRAENALLVSHDVVEVEAVDGGCVVTYDARLTLKGPLGLADPLLRLVFGRIGDRAAAGLRTTLEGVRA